MIKKLIFLGVLTLPACKSEPPVNSYLPPSNIAGRPQSQYGAPGIDSQGNTAGQGGQQIFGPSSQLQSPPENTYGTPAQFNPSNNINTEYGPPGDSNRGQGGFGQEQGSQSRSQSAFGQRIPSGFGQSGFGGRGNQELNQAEGSPQPQSNYGPPNGENTRSFGGGRQNSGGLGQSRTGGVRPGSLGAGQGSTRPQTSYGPPNNNREGSQIGNRGQGGFEQSTSGFDQSSTGFGGQDSTGFGQVGRPETSYGPPPNGALQAPNRDFEGDVNLQLTPSGSPQSSYGPPSVGDSSTQFSGRQRAGGPPSSSYGAPGFGGDSQRGGEARNQGSQELDVDGGESDEPAKYEFSYDVDDLQTGTKFGHSEQRDGDSAIGEYNVLLPDGRKQVVEYEAGLQGYKPQIRYEGGGNSGQARPGSSFGGLGNEGYPREDPSRPGNLALQGIGNEAGNPGGGPGQDQDSSQGFPDAGLNRLQPPLNRNIPGGPSQKYRDQRNQQGQGGNLGFSSGRPGQNNGFGRGSDQNEGYPPGRPGDTNQGFGRGGDSSSQGYPRSGPGGFESAGRERGQDRNGASSIQGDNEGYSRGGGAERNSFESQQGQQAGYPRSGPGRGQQGQGFGRQGAQGFNQERQTGFGQQARGLGQNGSNDANNNRGYARGGAPQGARNNALGGEGYPSGGPNGLRGSGY